MIAAARGARTAALVLGLLACGDGAKERRAVLERVDALRDATGARAADRRRLLESLRAVEADDALAVEARTACVAAYADLVEANDKEEASRAAMESGGRVDTIALAKQLDDATRLLEASRAAMPACDQATTRLRASLDR